MRRDRFQPNHLSVSTSEIHFNSLRMTNWFCAENICLSVLPATLNDSGRATSWVKQQSTTFWTIASQTISNYGLSATIKTSLAASLLHACWLSLLKKIPFKSNCSQIWSSCFIFQSPQFTEYSTNIQMHYVRVHGRCKRVILPLNSWQQRLAWKKPIQAFSSVQKHSDLLLYYCVL